MGSAPTDVGILQEPVEDRLFFAGGADLLLACQLHTHSASLLGPVHHPSHSSTPWLACHAAGDALSELNSYYVHGAYESGRHAALQVGVPQARCQPTTPYPWVSPQGGHCSTALLGARQTLRWPSLVPDIITQRG